MGNRHPLLLQLLCRMPVCLDEQRRKRASRGGCVFTSTGVVVGGEGDAAFFRLFGSGAVVAFAEEGSRLGCAGEGACFCRISTGFPLDACLRVSNRSG